MGMYDIWMIGMRFAKVLVIAGERWSLLAGCEARVPLAMEIDRRKEASTQMPLCSPTNLRRLSASLYPKPSKRPLGPRDRGGRSPCNGCFLRSVVPHALTWAAIAYRYMQGEIRAAVSVQTELTCQTSCLAPLWRSSGRLSARPRFAISLLRSR